MRLRTSRTNNGLRLHRVRSLICCSAHLGQQVLILLMQKLRRASRRTISPPRPGLASRYTQQNS